MSKPASANFIIDAARATGLAPSPPQSSHEHRMAQLESEVRILSFTLGELRRGAVEKAFEPPTRLTVNEWSKLINYSQQAITGWCRRHPGLGTRNTPDGRWLIERKDLRNFWVRERGGESTLPHKLREP
jgi:hypothetical protein